MVSNCAKNNNNKVVLIDQEKLLIKYIFQNYIIVKFPSMQVTFIEFDVISLKALEGSILQIEYSSCSWMWSCSPSINCTRTIITNPRTMKVTCKINLCRVSNSELALLYALVCKGNALHNKVLLDNHEDKIWDKLLVMVLGV